jgi:hypothetical protein
MTLTQAEFDRELERLADSPAWPLLHSWFTAKLVGRVVSGNPADAHDASVRAAQDSAGAAALLLAVGNHVQAKKQELIHGNRANRAASAPEEQRSSGRGLGNGKRAGRARKQAGPKESGTG